ncbi:MAG TPA: DUF4267 domain-containing protein [Ktedonobacterales bacterium]|jgi:hypothetical protein
MHDTTLRPLAAGLGLGTVAFGAVPLLVPRLFARLFGFPAPDAAAVSMMRSLGVRDVVFGMGLWSAAAHGGRFAPWVLARLLTDAGDSISVGAAVASGLRNPRFLALGALALGATAADLALYLAARGATADQQAPTPQPQVIHS